VRHTGKPERGAPPRLDRFGTLRGFIDYTLPRLIGGKSGSMAAAIIWVVLYDMADATPGPRGGLVYGASVQKLHERTWITRVTVRAALKKLIEAGALVVEKKGKVPVYKIEHLLLNG
jgi:hypothetical protein